MLFSDDKNRFSSSFLVRSVSLLKSVIGEMKSVCYVFFYYFSIVRIMPKRSFCFDYRPKIGGLHTLLFKDSKFCWLCQSTAYYCKIGYYLVYIVLPVYSHIVV